MKTWLSTLSLGFLLAPGRSAPPQPASGIDTQGLSSSVRPQDDFNAYVNGAWIQKIQIPKDHQSWGSFEILNDASEKSQRAIIEELSSTPDLPSGTDEQRVGDFYRSYMDTGKLEELGARPVAEDLNRILSAPSTAALVRLSAENRVAGIDSPLSLQVFPDLGDSTRYMVYLSQSGLSLPDRDYYFEKGEKYEALRAALPGYAAKLFRLAGVSDPESRGQAVLAVETRLAEPQWPAEETRNVQKLYNLYARTDLRSAFETIDWDGYLESSRIGGQAQVVIAQPSYVTALGKLVEEIPLSDWKSYFAFRLLDAVAPYLSDAFVQAAFDFSGRLVSGLEEQPPRWQRGVRNVNAFLGDAVGKLYVQRHFPPAAKARMEKLVVNLIETYGEAIEALPWMTAETKVRAQEKRKKFTYKIGYPEKWKDYAKLRVDRGDLVGNVKRAGELQYQRAIDKLGGPIDRTEWQMTPQTVNAYYDPTKNQIVFPAAILQPPFFNMEADDAVNYGAIGVVIGHEMGHAFDDQGRKFDGDGNLRDWWSEYDAAAYEESASTLAKEFDAFEPLPGLHVNGKLTLGENIGDLTGIAVSYRAYRKSLGGKEAPVLDGFSGAQRFFLGYAQIWRSRFREEAVRQLVLSNPHAPPEFRVNGPLRNSPEFFEAFGVKPGDGMWLPPGERVKIW